MLLYEKGSKQNLKKCIQYFEVFFSGMTAFILEHRIQGRVMVSRLFLHLFFPILCIHLFLLGLHFSGSRGENLCSNKIS